MNVSIFSCSGINFPRMEPEKARAVGWAGDSSFTGHGARGNNMASAGHTGADPERPDGTAACGSESVPGPR